MKKDIDIAVEFVNEMKNKFTTNFSKSCVESMEEIIGEFYKTQYDLLKVQDAIKHLENGHAIANDVSGHYVAYYKDKKKYYSYDSYFKIITEKSFSDIKRHIESDALEVRRYFDIIDKKYLTV